MQLQQQQQKREKSFLHVQVVIWLERNNFAKYLNHKHYENEFILFGNVPY